jgi:hypothetical protein
MITEELIDYIKTQVSSGVSREKITSDLLGQGGWTIEQINEAFLATQQRTISGSDLLLSDASKGNIWNKAVPKTNMTTTVVSLGLFLFSVFVVGGGLEVFVDSMLSEFAYMMLWTMLGFGFFVLLENFVFCTSLKDRTKSGLDPWIMMLIGLRNMVVILSVIPFIQLLGMAAIFFGGIPWIILYTLLLSLRFKKS